MSGTAGGSACASIARSTGTRSSTSSSTPIRVLRPPSSSRSSKATLSRRTRDRAPELDGGVRGPRTVDARLGCEAVQRLRVRTENLLLHGCVQRGISEALLHVVVDDECAEGV